LEYLSEKLTHPNQYLYHLLSEVMRSAIKKYYLVQKIEKVKELLVYDDLILTDIAYKLH
jgi:AraC-like DNA-binding protein